MEKLIFDKNSSFDLHRGLDVLYGDTPSLDSARRQQLFDLIDQPNLSGLIQYFILLPAMYGFANISGVFNHEFEQDLTNPAIVAAHVIWFAIAIYDYQPLREYAEFLANLDLREFGMDLPDDLFSVHKLGVLNNHLLNAEMTIKQKYTLAGLKLSSILPPTEMIRLFRQMLKMDDLPGSMSQEDYVLVYKNLVVMVQYQLNPINTLANMPEAIIWGGLKIRAGRPSLGFSNSRKHRQLAYIEPDLQFVNNLVAGLDEHGLLERRGLKYWKQVCLNSPDLVNALQDFCKKELFTK